MNFITGCFVKYGRVNFWTTPGHNDLVTSTKTLVDINDAQKQIILRKAKPNQMIRRLGVKNLRLTCLSQWTLVRYQQDKKCFPNLHRDIEYPNFDSYRKKAFTDVRKTTYQQGDEKYGVTYVVGFFSLIFSAYAVKTELTHFISSMAPAADVLAMASIEVDIAKIVEGQCASFKWRGKPLFIKHRSAADISSEANTSMSLLRDPQTPEQRCQKPEWLVVIGICTHLGCVPIPNSGDYPGGFYCPCHGSHYDNVGRTRKGPAPLNLEVPPHVFVTENTLLIG